MFAKDQPQYLPLPANVSRDGYVETKWRLSLKERIKILLSGSLYLHLMTFNQPLQPVRLSVERVEDL